MNNMQSSAQKGEGRHPLDWLYLAVSAHANCLIVFTRRGFGRDAFGLSGLLALALMFLYAGLAEAPGMFTYMAVWLAALALQRVGTAVRLRRGEVMHSRYSGWPWLAMKVPFVRREVTAKCFVEPMLCVLVGPPLMALSQPVGMFVLLGCFSLLAKGGIEREINRVRLQRMVDARIEQRQLSARFRGELNDL